jgi:serine/threonine-protein kinase
VLCGAHYVAAAACCSSCAGAPDAFACPECGRGDEHGTFVCRGCGRLLCASHYVPRSGLCGRCTPEPPPSTPTARVVAKRYVVVREIKRDARGSACEAADLFAGTRVYLRILEGPDLADDDRHRFIRGVAALRRVVHPNVAQLRDAGALGPGALYVAIEWVEGSTLAERIAAAGRLAPEQAVALVEQALAGLEAAHAAGIIHRDFTPAHILVRRTPSGERAQLAGFGIARAVASDDGTVTTWGVAVGTPRYMSPEQLRGRRLDERSDVFAAGVTLFAALAGRVPFDGERTVDVARAILMDPSPPLPPDVDSAARAAFEPIIHRCLAKDPAARFASVAELRRALAAAAPPARVAHP